MNLRIAKVSALSLLGLSLACAPAATRSQGSDRDVVTAADLQLHPDEPIEYVIQRKVSGVSVSRTQEGNLLLQIRGAMTAEGKGDPKPPLYVVNGVTIAPTADGALPTFNRLDIELIKVLKGAEAGIYGNEGAHGVILITTKRAPPRQ